MKRQITTLILLAAICHTVMAQTHLDIRICSRDGYLLKGPVQKITIDSCLDMSEKHFKKEHIFDKQGNLLSETVWGYDGELKRSFTNKYNETGCLIEKHSEDHKKETTTDYEVILNVPTKQIAYKNVGNGEISINTYSPKKFLIRYKKVTKERKLIRSSEYKRDSENRLVQYIKHDDRGEKVYVSQYQRNPDGSPLKRRKRDYEKNEERLYTYEYLQTDEHDNWIQRLDISYILDGKEKEKKNEWLTVRTIEYFEEE